MLVRILAAVSADVLQLAVDVLTVAAARLRHAGDQ